MTHCDRGTVYAYDQAYSPDFLWESVSGNKCRSLAGKPKLFFIQACRGDKYDYGVLPVEAAEMDDKSPSYPVPVMSDILVMYSCYDGYLSWRNLTTGWQKMQIGTIFSTLRRLLYFFCK